MISLLKAEKNEKSTTIKRLSRVLSHELVKELNAENMLKWSLVLWKIFDELVSEEVKEEEKIRKRAPTSIIYSKL